MLRRLILVLSAACPGALLAGQPLENMPPEREPLGSLSRSGDDDLLPGQLPRSTPEPEKKAPATNPTQTPAPPAETPAAPAVGASSPRAQGVQRNFYNRPTAKANRGFDDFPTDPKSVPDDMSAPIDYDDVVRVLIQQLLNDKHEETNDKFDGIRREKTESAAEREQRELIATQDAARKLSLRREAVPALTQLFKASYDQPESVKGAAKASYYSAWALARIRSAEAGLALLPALADPAIRSELRLLAVDAVGIEKSEEGVKALQKIANSDPDREMRKRAFSHLTLIADHWLQSEPTFLKGLSDTDGEIRTLAAKACHYAHNFVSANDKLLELAETDPVPAVRILAMLTLGRMRHKPALPSLARLLEDPETEEKVIKVALTTFSQISDNAFSKKENALAWWKREGEQKFLAAQEREQDAKKQMQAYEEDKKRQSREALAKLREDDGLASPKVEAPGANRPPELRFPGFAADGNAPKPIMLARPKAEPDYVPMKVEKPKDSTLFELLDEAKKPAPIARPVVRAPEPPPQKRPIAEEPLIIAPRVSRRAPSPPPPPVEESIGAQRRRLRAAAEKQ